MQLHLTMHWTIGLTDSVRVCNSWNSLPQHVIEAPTTNSFKNRLDKYWSDMGA